MKQILLRLSLPKGKTLYQTQFRALMARNPSAPQELFHYSDGKPSNGRPAVRFVGAKGWVGIMGDEASKNLIFEVAGIALKVVTQHFGSSVQITMEEHDFALVQMHQPKSFWIAEMAIKTRSRKAREQDIESLVAERLLKSIQATADKYGFDCPSPDDLGIQVEVTRKLGLAIGKSTGPVDEYATLVNANFIIHADLKGLWFAGNLTARGYGRIGQFQPRTVLSHPEERTQ